MEGVLNDVCAYGLGYGCIQCSDSSQQRHFIACVYPMQDGVECGRGGNRDLKDWGVVGDWSGEEDVVFIGEGGEELGAGGKDDCAGISYLVG